MALWILLLLAPLAGAQPIRSFQLGGTEAGWRQGGGGIDPLVLGGTLFAPELDTTNAPGKAVDFSSRPGWISPLRFDPEINVASRVLEEEGSVQAPNAVEEKKVVREQLRGIVNGDHRVAFERKPTKALPVNPLGIWVILDFARPIGVHRLRFYPRNSAVPAPGTPYQNDFLRGFEVWINDTLTTSQRSPDVLVLRRPNNEEPVVDLDVPPQYVRLVKLKSLTEVPWEIDELEVYATGYLPQATYLSDLLDLRDRAALGRVRWQEEVVGEAIRSALSVWVRTGADDSPLVFHRKVLDSLGVWLGKTEVVEGEEYAALDRREKGLVKEDAEHWSPWKAMENGQLVTAPGPRRYAQFRLDFRGQLSDTRQVRSLSFEYLQPPLADTLRAEVFPRLVQAEQRASFRYAVLLRRVGRARGYDRLEVDANAQVEEIRDLKLNGEPVPFQVEYARPDGFALRLPLVQQDSAVVEFSFDVPVFRFGTTFSGRAYNQRAGDLPQQLEPGNVGVLGLGDFAELSGLSVAIPREQVGKLIGEIATSGRVCTPNGDGINDRFEVFFNLLQLTKPTPVVLEFYDLGGRRVHALGEERSIGPARYAWDGRLGDGRLVLPGHYLWVLRVEADAFEERHAGVLGVGY